MKLILLSFLFASIAHAAEVKVAVVANGHEIYSYSKQELQNLRESIRLYEDEAIHIVGKSSLNITIEGKTYRADEKRELIRNGTYVGPTNLETLFHKNGSKEFVFTPKSRNFSKGNYFYVTIKSNGEPDLVVKFYNIL